MKLSKLYLYLGLTLIGLLSFIPSGCCSGGPISGGLADFSDPKAPKVIDSDNIRKFSLRFKYIGGIAKPAVENDCPPFPAGNYLLEAVRKGDTAHFMLSCDRQDTTTPLVFQKDLPVEALLDLQGIIRKYNLPAINGSSLRNSALGTSLSFEVLYDTDERLYVRAEGGVSTLPHGWCGTDVFLELFLKKLDAEGLLVPPLYSCIYSCSSRQDGFLYSLELEADRHLPGKQAIFKKTLPQQTADNPFGERVVKQVTVPKEKLEATETIIAKYRMRDWKDLPYRENLDGNTDFISIVFNCSDGNNICLDSDQELPPEYKEAFEAVHQALIEAEKDALAQLK
ncbi:hypothetical protein SAMN05216583_15016 [Selenomonas sp. KH1T6]|nr:hypothetical protein SAMN05216583_15016 [Selenomonas ruminantium]